jgi:hypothetical protein
MKNLYIIFIAVLFINGCKKESCYDCNDTHTYFDLTQEQIAKTPYFTNSAFDTLTFLSNKGDTLTFAKIKTHSSYFRTINSNCPDCPVHYSYYQELHNTYQTIKGNGKFEVRHVLLGNSIKVMGTSRDFIEIIINNSIYFFYDDMIGSKTYPTYKSEIQFNNFIYKDVFANYSNLNDTINSNYFYFNKDFGAFYINEKSLNIEHLIIH